MTGHITGDVSPSDSYNHYNDLYNRLSRNLPPDYMSNPHWWRYRDKNCCHPKNTWHCCWHRETYWNDSRQCETNTSRSRYNCRGTGFLRCLCLVLMWSVVWPCVGVYLLCYWCSLRYSCCCCFDFGFSPGRGFVSADNRNTNRYQAVDFRDEDVLYD